MFDLSFLERKGNFGNRKRTFKHQSNRSTETGGRKWLHLICTLIICLHQLNKVITENVENKSTGTPEPATPKTPLSPVDSPIPSTPPKPPPPQARSPPPPPPPSITLVPSSNQEGVYSEVVKKVSKKIFIQTLN